MIIVKFWNNAQILAFVWQSNNDSNHNCEAFQECTNKSWFQCRTCFYNLKHVHQLWMYKNLTSCQNAIAPNILTYFARTPLLQYPSLVPSVIPLTSFIAEYAMQQKSTDQGNVFQVHTLSPVLYKPNTFELHHQKEMFTTHSKHYCENQLARPPWQILWRTFSCHHQKV